MAAPSSHEEGLLYYLLGAGAIIGLGKLLVSEEKLTFRKAVGHCIVSAGLGGTAALIQIPVPEAPLPVIIAAACGMASLGASTINMILQKYLTK